MREAEAIRDELSRLRGSIADAITRAREMEKELAQSLSHFSIGQRVIYERREFEITGVYLSFSDDVMYEARKIKKDGRPGKGIFGLPGALVTQKGIA
jgi:hypothetical protein